MGRDFHVIRCSAQVTLGLIELVQYWHLSLKTGVGLGIGSKFKVQSSCMIAQQLGSIRVTVQKFLQMYIQAIKYTYKVQVSQLQPLHHDFKRHFQVQSRCSSIMCSASKSSSSSSQSGHGLFPFPFALKNSAQILQSPDMPGPQVHHTIP